MNSSMKLANQTRDVRSWSQSDLNSFIFVNLTSPSCCSRSIVETMFLRIGALFGSNCLHRGGLRRSAQQDVDTQETIQRVHEEGSINTVSSASRPYDWTALPALSAKDYLYLCALIGGLGSITSLAIPFLLKDVMHLHPAETALLGAIASIPMLFKPAVAVASDHLPLMGYRRKPYLVKCTIRHGDSSWSWKVLGSALHSISLIALAHLPAGTSFVPIALIVLAISSAGAVVVTVKDTLMLETSNRGEAGGADLISDMSILATGGALSVSYLSGALLHVMSCQTLIRFSATGPLLLTGAAMLMEEEAMSHSRPPTILRKSLVLESVLSGAASLGGPLKLLAATIMVPSYSTALFYYSTSPALHFTPEVMGRFQVCGSLASIAAAIFYRNYLSRRVPIQKIMKVVSWVSVPVAASSLLLTLPAFEGRLDPIRVALARHVLIEMGSVLTYLPITTQLAKSAPKEGSGVYFAIFSSGIEALNLASSVVSSEVTNVLGVTSENFANLTPLILVCTAFNSIPFFVTLTMDGSDNSDLTQGSEDGQHELCQSNGEGLLLVEHAHI